MNEALCRYLKPGDCFYDVGAHIGFYSLIAARLVGQAGHIIAFEPDPDNAETLRENAAKNGFLGVCVVCAAISDKDEVVRFHRSTHNDPSRMSGMVMRENLLGIRESEILSCRAVSLDSFCSSHQTPNLVKVDVEGAELQVLEGARYLLRQKKPVLIIEVHDQQNLPTVRSLLSGLGYTLEPLGLKAGETRARNFVASVGP
jgi:FkbM family methyltransferase